MTSRDRGSAHNLTGQARITRGALLLLIAEATLSLVFLLSDRGLQVELARWLAASSHQVWSELKLWTLLTSPLMHDQLIGLIFHGLILWLFVPVLERWWGMRKFLLFALWTSLAGTVIGSLAGLLIGSAAPIMGLDPFIYACIVAFGILYGRQQVRFFGVLPMTGRQLMYGIMVVAALVVVIGQRWVDGAAYAAAMGLAAILTSGRWTPRLWYLRWKKKRLSRHLRVVRDDERPTWLN